MTQPMKNSQHSQLSILFADDEPSLQELMRLELPHLGHRVAVCPDGYSAIAALERESFDCLIVDLDMPGMNGIQVIERAATLSPSTESIVLTGKQSLESAVAALRFGVIDYLTVADGDDPGICKARYAGAAQKQPAFGHDRC